MSGETSPATPLDPESSERSEYAPPTVESHRPLDVVSAWTDRSSELPGI